MDEYFAIVRRTAAGREEGEGLVIVKPDRSLMVLLQMAESPQLKGMAAKVARIVPADKPRNIAVITQTVFQKGPQGQTGLAEVGKAIPFFGILVGLSYVGHAVWLIDGREDVLVPGCREADVLVVDSAVRASLPAGWEAKVAAVMRNANILLHNRTTFAFSPIRKVGTNPTALEFK
jgi:hypothetical protein